MGGVSSTVNLCGYGWPSTTFSHLRPERLSGWVSSNHRIQRRKLRLRGPEVSRAETGEEDSCSQGPPPWGPGKEIFRGWRLGRGLEALPKAI